MRHDKHSLYKNLQGFLLRNAGPLRRALNLQSAVRARASRRLSGQLAPSPTLMQVQSLKEWKTALLLATDPEQPNRLALRKLYESLMLDNHLMATVNNRIEAVQGAPFKLVDKNGAENSQITALFKKAWFIDFVRIALMSRYTGTKVIELYELREDGHLKQIRQIDMAHVVAQKGIIVKEPGDSNGWPYKQGVFADYYLQVGSDGLLGLFAQLAPIVLAKKLAVGSWLDYIEKFGVPPIFMFTDREDRQRMEELYQALSNFKSSHFTVGRGQERVEIGNTHQSSSSSVFQDLIQLANAEISKRINGATGTTDEKAHVGAARVHAEMLKTKVSLDKFFIEVLVNEELLPKLTRLSPLYKATTAYRFAWDETESLSLAELIETVSHLSAYYQIDTQYLSEKTGIPIKGHQQNTYAATSPSESELGEAKKKRPSTPAADSVAAFYKAAQGITSRIQGLSLAPYTQLIQRIIGELHRGSLSAEDLDQGLISQTFSDLNQAAQSGWGVDFTRFSADQQANLSLDIQANLYRFAQAKTYAQLQAFGELLYQDGKLRPFEDFKKQALKRHEDYNLNYLQAEYQTARQASHHARQWQRFEKDKDLFPSLVYKTAGDARVRAAHKRLHGVVKALEDPFWDTHYPPNGWRCRCYVVQSNQRPAPLATYEPVQGKALEDPVDPVFGVNTGKSGRIYSDQHPYFILSHSAPEPVQQAFERTKLHAPYREAYQSKTGGSVAVSLFTDKEDFKARYQTALTLADGGMQVRLPAHILLKGHKNFPYQIDGKPAVRKLQTREEVTSTLRWAKRQGVAVLVFEIQAASPYTLTGFTSLLKSQLTHHALGALQQLIVVKGKTLKRIQVD